MLPQALGHRLQNFQIHKHVIPTARLAKSVAQPDAVGAQIGEGSDRQLKRTGYHRRVRRDLNGLPFHLKSLGCA